MRDFMAVSKALSDASRARIVMFLRGGELCVCQIVEMLGLAPSTVSKHLDILYRSGLIDSRKAGRWVYYRLPAKPPSGVSSAMSFLRLSLADDPRIIEDARLLKRVLKMDKEKLCSRYKG